MKCLNSRSVQCCWLLCGILSCHRKLFSVCFILLQPAYDGKKNTCSQRQINPCSLLTGLPSTPRVVWELLVEAFTRLLLCFWPLPSSHLYSDSSPMPLWLLSLSWLYLTWWTLVCSGIYGGSNVGVCDIFNILHYFFHWELSFHPQGLILFRGSSLSSSPLSLELRWAHDNPQGNWANFQQRCWWSCSIICL